MTYGHYLDLNLDKDRDCFWTYDTMEYMIWYKPERYGICSIDDVYKRMEMDDPDNWLGLNYDLSADILLTHDIERDHKLFELIMEKLIAKNIIFKLPEF